MVQYIGGVQYTGGSHEYIGGVKYIGGYHECIREWDIMNTLRDVQYIRGYHEYIGVFNRN